MTRTLAIPHFYNRFYVFQYATSISAGNMFATEILRGTHEQHHGPDRSDSGKKALILKVRALA
jgi:oligoendopeptidase F